MAYSLKRLQIAKLVFDTLSPVRTTANISRLMSLEIQSTVLVQRRRLKTGEALDFCYFPRISFSIDLLIHFHFYTSTTRRMIITTRKLQKKQILLLINKH
jgi:hypothetical protein